MSSRKLVATVVGSALVTAGVLGGGLAQATPSPYTSDGRWLVPSEITPGTYRVTPTSGMGYSEVCADYTCEIGTNGFISNENYRGPGILVIPSNAVSVELHRVSLARMG
jgi:hypothetical protein